MVKLLGGAPTSNGKAAIVGSNGDIEQARRCCIPSSARPNARRVGGGEAIISSNVKVAGVGTAIDVPLAHKDNIWAFDFLDTMTVSVADAPRRTRSWW